MAGFFGLELDGRFVPVGFSPVAVEEALVVMGDKVCMVAELGCCQLNASFLADFASAISPNKAEPPAVAS